MADQTIRLTVPGFFPSTRISRGETTTASAISAFVMAIRVMLKLVGTTTDRPAVSDTFSGAAGAAVSCACDASSAV